MINKLLLCATLSLSLCKASTAQTLPANLSTDGLVGWWPFNGNANDESGNGNDGVVNGAILTENRFGVSNVAYSFDGVDDWIELPEFVLPSDNQSYSISFWALLNKETDRSESYTVFDDRDQNSFGNKGRFIVLSDTAETYWFQMGDNAACSNNNFQPFEWINISCIYDNENDVITVYKNGNFSCSINYTDEAFYPGLRKLIIGKGQSPAFSSVEEWNGKVDDIAVYNRALSQEEITALYTGEPVNPPTACNPLPSNLQNGLVGYWPFCGDANDESGNGNDGTVNGATLTEDRFGLANAAYDFDGDQDFIVVANEANFDFQTEFTINAWVKVNSNNQGQKMIVTKFQNFDDSYALATSNKLILGQLASAPTQWTELIGTNEIDSLTWANITLVLANQNLKLFLNGVEEASATYSSNVFNSQAPVVFGDFFGNNSNEGAAFEGIIDDIGIWNRALTAEEVQQLYTLNACTFAIYDTTFVTIYDSVSVSTTDTLIINTLITAVQPAQENTFLVYPNPTGSQITINNGNVSILGGYTMRISNSIGQEVYNQNITQTEVTLDLSNWGGNGLYVLYILDPQQNIVAVKQIVLQ
jgi:hypothetical protein